MLPVPACAVYLRQVRTVYPVTVYTIVTIEYTNASSAKISITLSHAQRESLSVWGKGLSIWA